MAWILPTCPIMRIAPESEHRKSGPSGGLGGLRAITRIFDELVHVPGTNLRFGLDALLGLLPGGGDLLGGAFSAYAILIAARLGAPPTVIAHMVLNIGIDTVVGAVPLLGDLFDVGWKANRKNLKLLERYEASPEEVKRGSMALVAGALLIIAALLVLVAMLSLWIGGQIIAALR
ncbi:MAG TPA: DUF4112 domain-containing protein [Longimicrobiales bacterium]|nr:DUF4112 domain-containing protein [Longimicrobiales bacterium]